MQLLSSQDLNLSKSVSEATFVNFRSSRSVGKSVIKHADLSSNPQQLCKNPCVDGILVSLALCGRRQRQEDL